MSIAAISAPRIRSGNGQHPQSARTRSRRQMELETAREIRHHSAGSPVTSGTVPEWLHHDADIPKVWITPRWMGRATRHPKSKTPNSLLAVFDKEAAEARAALDQSAATKTLRKNWTLLAGGTEDFHHAARRLHSQHGHESFDPSSRATHRVFASAQRSSSRSVRPVRRRTVDSFLPPKRWCFLACGFGSKFSTRYNGESVLRRLCMETPVILSAVRTPVGKFQGGLSSFSAPELGGKVVAEAARRAGTRPQTN